MKDYLTVVEFAAAGITKQAVYKRIKQDLAPYVKSKTEKRLSSEAEYYPCGLLGRTWHTYSSGTFRNS